MQCIRSDPEKHRRAEVLPTVQVEIFSPSPQKAIAQGIDWRSLNDLKKALTG